MYHPWKHFRTITRHKILVMRGCFRIGLYKQGLLHDLSKYSLTEFLPGAKYYQGTMSPNNAERMDKGVSRAWLHHKGRNKHHLEYWIDYMQPEDKPLDAQKLGMGGMKMPIRYVCEMYVDRVCASKNYQKDQYTDESALLYFYRSKPAYIIHPDTAALLEYLLNHGPDSLRNRSAGAHWPLQRISRPRYCGRRYAPDNPMSSARQLPAGQWPYAKHSPCPACPAPTL